MQFCCNRSLTDASPIWRSSLTSERMAFTNDQPKNRLSLKLSNKKLVQQKLLNSAKSPAKVEQKLLSLNTAKSLAKVERNGTVPSFAGLVNLGNSCYVNSILQALRFCPGFSHGLAALHNSSVSDESGSSRHPIISHLHQLLQSMSEEERLQKNGCAVEPADFVAALKEEHPVFAGYLQHDAQEVLKFLLTSIQEVSTNTPIVYDVASHPESPRIYAGKKRKLAAPESDCGSVKKPLIGKKQFRLTEYYSPQTPVGPLRHQSLSSSRPQVKRRHSDFITDTFQGQLIYQTHCYECDSYTKHSESFLDITVPVSSTCLPGFPQGFSPVKQTCDNRVGPYSLSWALSQFASRERLKGDNKYWCDQCGHLAEAERSILFLQLPHIVTVHLNRFSTQQWCTTMSSVTVGKVVGNIATPVSLRLRPWCSPECTNKNQLYELFAVVFHSGSSCSSGHYTTCVRSKECHLLQTGVKGQECHLLQTGVKGQDRDDWIYFDDDTVDTISQSDMLAMLSPLAPGSTTAYILFYKNT